MCKTLEHQDINIGFIVYAFKFRTYQDACGDLFTIQNDFKIDVSMTMIVTKLTSRIYEALDEILWKLTPAGIPKYLLNHHASIIFGTYGKIEEKEEKILKLSDLKFVFIFWMSACGFSVILFVMENFTMADLKNFMKNIHRCLKCVKEAI
jgi:hypothetical protein